MSKRYGRNQRRQARETIAAQQLAVERAEEDKQYAVKVAAQARSEWKLLERDVDHIVTTLIDLLGDAHVAVPIQYSREVPPRGRIDRWAVRHKPSAVVESRQIPELAAINVVRLLRLVAEVDRDPMKLGVYIRFRDKNDIGKFKGNGVYVSLEEFRRSGISTETIDFLLGQVRESFIEALHHG